MSQPKLSPISLRLPPDVLAALDVKAKAAGLTRHGALVQAVGAWVAGSGGVARQVPARAAAPKPVPAKTWAGGHPKPGKR